MAAVILARCSSASVPANRSPHRSTRSSTCSVVNRSASPDPTSSQPTGVETVGSSRARSEYGATVVFAELFWLQSTNTLPPRTAFVMRDTISAGCAFSSRSATQCA